MMEGQNHEQEEYISVLNDILRTNLNKKMGKVLEKVASLHSTPNTSSTGSGDNSNPTMKQCIMSKTIKCNQNCIAQIQIVRDNLLSTFMATTELNTKSKYVIEDVTRHLSQTVGNLISLVSEASSLSMRIHENAMGLHIAADFLRDSKNLDILDFSKSGRIPISHFSSNEATIICLSGLQISAEKLANEETTGESRVGGQSTHKNFVKIYKSFERAITYLHDSAQLASQVFRVLLYCNSKGKQALQDYLETLKPQEINDMITELQTIRRQFDEINILMDRLGWSLADISGRCTGKEIRFEEIRKEGFQKVKSVETTEREKKCGKTPIQGKGKEKLEKKQCVQLQSMKAKNVESSQSIKNSDAQSGFASNKKKGTKLKPKGEKFALKLERVLGRRDKSELGKVQRIVSEDNTVAEIGQIATKLQTLPPIPKTYSGLYQAKGQENQRKYGISKK